MIRRKVILGLGNILNGDEGAGIYALKELEKLLSEELKKENGAGRWRCFRTGLAALC